MFKVGDNVVHPAHGAGVVTAVEQKDVLDEFNRYYVINLAAQDMRLMVPVRMADEIGMRKVATKKHSRAILDILSSDAEALPDDFKKRQAAIHERLRDGGAESLATVVRDMAYRSREKTYSPTEARLYDQARSMLGGELALSQGKDVEAALQQIDDLVAAPPDSDDDA